MYKISLERRALNFLSRKFFGPIIRYLWVKFNLAERYKFLDTNSAAIGHLCHDVESFLKEKSIERYPFRGVLLADRNQVANSVLSKLWAENEGLLVIENPVLCYVFGYLRVYKETGFECGKYTPTYGKPAKLIDIYNKYSDPRPVVTWSAQIYSEAKSLFERLFPGVHPERLVILHSRDSSFDEKSRNHNFFIHKYRNSDVESYSDILKYLKQIGYVTIRIGEYQNVETSSENFYLKLPSLSRYETDLLYVYMPSVCALFLGSASGPMNLAALWNRPIFVLNFLPYCLLRQYPKMSMTLPKLLFQEGRILGVAEIFDRGFHLYNEDKQYEESGLEIVSNAPGECMDDFKEFFEAFVEGDEELQQELANSPQQINYRKVCPSDADDYHSRGLIARRLFEKYKLI